MTAVNRGGGGIWFDVGQGERALSTRELLRRNDTRYPCGNSKYEA